MPSPIVRWRYATLENVREILNVLPKFEVNEDYARNIIRENWYEEHNNDFFRNTYQLAVQIGLYFFANGKYYPRFTYSPADEEIEGYLNNWIDHYYVPNPYVNGFNHLDPIPIIKGLIKIVRSKGGKVDWEVARNELFQVETTNEDVLKNSINSHSEILKIENDILSIRSDVDEHYIQEILGLEVTNHRNDLVQFFNFFSNYKSFGESFFVKSEQEVLEEINSLSISETEKVQLAKSRVGQGVFREALLNELPICPITGCNEPQLLIASHIKPWRDSTNQERLDPKNGFLFTPSIDKLFDKGFISFSNEKTILISDKLSTSNREALNLITDTKYPNLVIDGREEYLNYHRENIFSN